MATSDLKKYAAHLRTAAKEFQTFLIHLRKAEAALGNARTAIQRGQGYVHSADIGHTDKRLAKWYKGLDQLAMDVNDDQYHDPAELLRDEADSAEREREEEPYSVGTIGSASDPHHGYHPSWKK